MKVKAPKGLYRKFDSHIRKNKIQAYIVAASSKMSQSHLSLILSGDRPLTEEARGKLNSALNTNI